MKPRVPSAAAEGILFILLAFAPLAFGSVEPWSRAILETLSFMLALACFLHGSRTESLGGNFGWLFPASFAALGLIQGFRPIPADAPRTLGPFTASPHETRAAVLLWSAYAALLWSVPRVIGDHRTARRLARFLFALGITVSVFGLLQAASGGGRLYWLRAAPGASPFGPYYNRDHAANLLLMCLALGIGVIGSKWREFPEVDGPLPSYRAEQARLAAGVIVIFAGLAACMSRGAFAAIPLAAAAMVFLGADFAKTPRERLLRTTLSVGGAALLVLTGIWSLGLHAGAGGVVENAIAVRLSIYSSAWRWWLDAPLFGTGLGSFASVFPSYQELTLTGIVSHAHCDWIETAVEGGLCAEILALAGIALAAAAAARTWRRARSREMRALIAGALAATAAFCAHSLLDFSFQIPANAAVFLILIGYLLSAAAWADKAPGPRSQPPSMLAAAAAAACFLALSYAAVNPAAAAWIADYDLATPDAASPLRRALVLDDEPRFSVALSKVLIGIARGGEGNTPRPAREALRLALSASELEPFDSDALFEVAEALTLLGRPRDADLMYERAARVRFPEVLPQEHEGKLSRQHDLDVLKGLNLLPQQLEKR